jgi:hypothetical protein
LRHFGDYHQKNWIKHLKLAEFAVNDSQSSSTGYTPFFLAFGFHPRRIPHELSESICPAAIDLLTSLSVSLQLARTKIAAAQANQKRNADLKRSRVPCYMPGELVMLNSKNIK